MLQLSIIIATHNRPGLLSKCIESLLPQKSKETEIVIIDSSDQKNNKIQTKNIKYIYTNKKGLSSSRNLGIHRAKGRFVAFIDDDSIAGSTWVKMILLFIKKHPKTQAFGGGYSRYNLNPLPKWFPPDYGINDLGNKERVLKTGKEWLSGTNMIFKKDSLGKMGGFDESLGMRGKKLGYGEETNLQMRLRQKGVNVHYSPKLKVRHLIAEYKQNLWWLLKSSFYSGQTSFVSHRRTHNPFLYVVLFVHKILMFSISFLTPSLIPFKRRIYYSFHWLFYGAGQLTSYLRHIKDQTASFLRRTRFLILKKTGQYPKTTIQHKLKSEFLGSEYGGWAITPTQLSSKSIVYSLGIGEDISFDIEIIKKYKVNVFAFDPTLKSVKWLKQQALPKKFKHYQYAISDYSGTGKFYPPIKQAHVSYTLDHLKKNQNFLKVRVRKISNMMDMLKHQKIEILKMDTEGSEYKIIPSLIKEGIYPKQILIEFHHRFRQFSKEDTNETIKMLNNQGYKVFFISENGDQYSFVKIA